MSPLPSCRVLFPLALCAALAACASSTDPPAGSVTRTAAPLGYEKTINNYFAFRLPGPQKNTRVIVSPPEPGSCPGDGYVNSARGWVVPVSRETFSGELTGRETIRITAKQYYFWFMGNTIAGITRRLDLCPGIESAFSDIDAPARPAWAAVATPVNAETANRARADAASQPPAASRAPDRAAKPAPAKAGTARRAKKKARPIVRKSNAAPAAASTAPQNGSPTPPAAASSAPAPSR